MINCTGNGIHHRLIAPQVMASFDHKPTGVIPILPIHSMLLIWIGIIMNGCHSNYRRTIWWWNKFTDNTTINIWIMCKSKPLRNLWKSFEEIFIFPEISPIICTCHKMEEWTICLKCLTTHKTISPHQTFIMRQCCSSKTINHSHKYRNRKSLHSHNKFRNSRYLINSRMLPSKDFQISCKKRWKIGTGWTCSTHSVA